MNLALALVCALQEERPAFEAAVRGRATDVSGGAGEGLEYSDFFRAGFGTSLQVSWILAPEESSLGLWASLGFDRFGGDGYSDDLGDRVSTDPLDRYLLLAGPRLRVLFDEDVAEGNFIFLDLRAGGGAAYFDEVQSVFHVGGVTRKGVELLAAGWTGASELALSAGMTSRTVHFGLGLGYRWIGAPERGSGASGVVDPEGWRDLFFEIGWEYRF